MNVYFIKDFNNVVKWCFHYVSALLKVYMNYQNIWSTHLFLAPMKLTHHMWHKRLLQVLEFYDIIVGMEFMYAYAFIACLCLEKNFAYDFH